MLACQTVLDQSATGQLRSAVPKLAYSRHLLGVQTCRRLFIVCKMPRRVIHLDWCLQQRIAIHFCVKIGLTVAETIHGIQVAYTPPLSERQIQWWFASFTAGRREVVDLPCAPKPKSTRNPRTIRHVRRTVEADRCLTVREVAEHMDLHPSITHRIIYHDLGLRRKCAKFVPHLLTAAHRMQ